MVAADEKLSPGKPESSEGQVMSRGVILERRAALTALSSMGPARGPLSVTCRLSMRPTPAMRLGEAKDPLSPRRRTFMLA